MIRKLPSFQSHQNDFSLISLGKCAIRVEESSQASYKYIIHANNSNLENSERAFYLKALSIPLSELHSAKLENDICISNRKHKHL